MATADSGERGDHEGGRGGIHSTPTPDSWFPAPRPKMWSSGLQLAHATVPRAIRFSIYSPQGPTLIARATAVNGLEQPNASVNRISSSGAVLDRPRCRTTSYGKALRDGCRSDWATSPVSRETGTNRRRASSRPLLPGSEDRLEIPLGSGSPDRVR